MHSNRVRARAAARLAEGATLSEVSRELGVSRSTLRAWSGAERPTDRAGACPRCDDAQLDAVAYAALLGFYLGDGCISAAPRYFALRVSCDATYPGIVAAVKTAVSRVRPAVKVFHVPAPGTVVLQAHWKHWPCLFPQHGPGRKHDRPIVLEEWQRVIVEAHPAEFLRGLFHSDGSSTLLTACRTGLRRDCEGAGGRWLGLAPRSEARAEGWIPAAGAHAVGTPLSE